MIDPDGFRKNVGIIIVNHKNKVLFAKRVNQQAWQFPQGGVDAGERAEEAMYRELYEEVGLEKHHVKILGVTKHWLKYKLPRRFIRKDSPECIGQKQKWFLLRFIGKNSDVKLNLSHKDEFDGWEWVSFWYPIREVISFKRDVYRKALFELSSLVFKPKYNNPIKHKINHILD